MQSVLFYDWFRSHRKYAEVAGEVVWMIASPLTVLTVDS